MRIFRSLLMWMGAASVSAAGIPSGVHAQDAATLVLEQEMACQRALEDGSIEALEEYLRRYPEGNSACNALALNALSAFVPPGGDGPGFIPDLGQGPGPYPG